MDKKENENGNKREGKGFFFWGGGAEIARPDNAAPDTTEASHCHCPPAVRIDCCLYCRSNSGVRARLNRTR